MHFAASEHELVHKRAQTRVQTLKPANWYGSCGEKSSQDTLLWDNPLYR